RATPKLLIRPNFSITLEKLGRQKINSPSRHNRHDKPTQLEIFAGKRPVANARTPRLRGRHSTPPSYTTFVYRTGSLGATPGVLSLFESMAISIPGRDTWESSLASREGKGHM